MESKTNMVLVHGAWADGSNSRSKMEDFMHSGGRRRFEKKGYWTEFM